MKRHASLNRVYRLVWSRVRNAWVAVSELAPSQGKGRKSLLRMGTVAGALTLAFGSSAYALPMGGSVASGTASISSGASTMTVNQASQNASINWQSFNIGSTETVNFVQPSGTSIAVNRILGADGSQIYGHLNANGQVWLINPNGVLFGKDAQVNVGGLVASTLDVNDASVGNGSVSFSGSGTGSVINQGTLNAANGGYVALVGNHVGNQGTITAQLGAVALAAGSAATLTFSGNNLVHVQVDQSTLNNLAENGGLMQADGGMVVMTAGAKDAVLASVVNNSGVIEARTVANHGGTITLLGGMSAGQVNVDGTLDASAPNGGNGGSIETSAASVAVANGANVTTAAPQGLTGTWLIDPADFTIAPSGGDMTGTALSNALINNSVTIQSSSGKVNTNGNGDINVYDNVSWSANTLTLTAANNINIGQNNAANSIAMTVTGNGSLTMNPATANGTETSALTGTVLMGMNGSGFAGRVDFGGTGALTINGNSYIVITSLGTYNTASNSNLQGMMNNSFAQPVYYALGSNIDASATATSTWNSGLGFTPIGNSTTPFIGIFDGLGHTITGLTINSSANSYVGLFGYAGPTAVIRNVGLIGASITGSSYVGSLVGFNYGGTIRNSFATGNVMGNSYVGGLVGSNGNSSYAGGSIGNSFSAAGVTGNANVGGLAGANFFGGISNSYATGSVTGVTYAGTASRNVGGLVGYNYNGSISSSYAAGGAVSGAGYVGGLVGLNYGGAGNISNSYAAGNVTGSSYVGGLVGSNGNFSSVGGVISGSYAKGKVTGVANGTTASSKVGGLAGANYGSISNSYAVGNVTGGSYVGGLVGYNYGGIGNSYATGNVTGGNWVGGLVGFNATDPSGTVFGTINSSYGTGNVSGVSNIGGLAGGNYGWIIAGWAKTGSVSGSSYVGGLVGSNGGWIGSGSYAAVHVSGTKSVGGLVGYNVNNGSVSKSGEIDNGYATGAVAGSGISGGTDIGGLVGTNFGAISASYAMGAVAGNGANNVGGLVGSNSASGTITESFANGNVTGGGNNVGGLAGGNYGSLSDSYATGSVSGASNVGGLVGANYGSGSIANTYTTGAVTGANPGTRGGFAGYSAGSVSASFWSAAANPALTDSSGATGLNQSDMNSYSTFVNAGWSIANSGNAGNTWRIYNGYTAPLLWGFLQPLTVSASSITTTYNGTQVTRLQNVSYSVPGVTSTSAHLYNLASAYGTGGLNAGTYTPQLYSDQFGYDISYSSVPVYSGTLTINQAPLSVAGTVAASSKTYDGTTAATLTGGTLSGTIFGSDSVTLVQSGAFSQSNAGNGLTVTATDTLSGASASNYVLTQPAVSGTANINPAPLTVSGLVGDRTYNGTTADTLTGTPTLSGLVGNQTLSFNGNLTSCPCSVTLSSANAGTETVTGASFQLANGTNGGLASNYSLQPLTMIISQAPLSVAGTVTANNKTYDGTTAATLTGGTLSGTLYDSVTLVQSGAFSQSNAGNGLTVTATDTLSGASASNYVLTQPAVSGTANINRAPLTVSGLSGTNQTYNGSTVDALTGTATLVGLVGNQTLTLGNTSSGTLASANAGTESVTTNITLSDGTGAKAGLAANYILTQPTLAVTISPAILTATGTEVYNGTTNFAGSNLVITGVNGETFTATGNGTLSSVNGETNQPLASVSGLTLNGVSGALTSNYQALSVANTSVSVVPLVLSGDSFTFPAGTFATSPQSQTAGAGSAPAGALNRAAAAILAPVFAVPAPVQEMGGITVVDGGIRLPADAPNE